MKKTKDTKPDSLPDDRPSGLPGSDPAESSSDTAANLMSSPVKSSTAFEGDDQPGSKDYNLKFGDNVFYLENGETFYATVLKVRELEDHMGTNNEPLISLGFFKPVLRPDARGEFVEAEVIGTSHQHELVQFRHDVHHRSFGGETGWSLTDEFVDDTAPMPTEVTPKTEAELTPEEKAVNESLAEQNKQL